MRRLLYHLLYYMGFTKNSSPRGKAGRTLVFEDNFRQKSWSDQLGEKWLIGEIWGLYHPDSPNQYFVAPEPSPEGGRFFIRYQPKKFGELVIPFAVSHLSTCNSFRQQYGRFECRCTVPTGTWPAFWLWGLTWPPEIDIFEEIENRHNMNLIYGTGRKERVCQGMRVELGVFHEFALEWEPSKMSFFVDGVLVFRYKGKALKWYNDTIAQMWVVINHGMREQKHYYSEMIVDYIRVYKGKK